MRFRLVICLLALSLFASSAYAGTYTVADNAAFLAPFNANTYRPSNVNAGSCAATGIGLGGNNIVYSLSGTWPALNDCTSVNGAYQIQGTSGMNVAAGGSGVFGLDTDTLAYVTSIHSDRAGTFKTALVGTSTVQKTDFNPALPSNGAIMSLAWCGERFDAAFTKTTLSPSAITLVADDNHQRCDDRFIEWGLGTRSSREEAAFTTEPNLPTPYTFPLPFACTGYTLKVNNRAQNDWPAPGNYPMTASPPTGTPTRYVYQYSSNSNTQTVTVNVANGVATGVTVASGDGSSDYGGISFSIVCNGLRDPDSDRTVCTAPYHWTPDTTTPLPTAWTGEACCGDDTTDVNKVVNGYTCTKRTDNTFQWVAPDAACLPTAQTVCCKADADVGKAYGVGNEQYLCTKSTTYQWARASISTGTQFAIQGTSTTPTTSVVSDGAQWVACTNTEAPPTAATYGAAVGTPPPGGNNPLTVPPFTQTANACQQAIGGVCRVSCESQYQAGCLFSGSGSQDCNDLNSCYANCPSVGPATCPNPLTCTNSLCECPAGQFYDQATNSCGTAQCPSGYTFANAICTKTTSGTQNTGSVQPVTAFATQPVCSLVSNAAVAATAAVKYRCAAGTWVPDTTAPVFSRGTQTPPQYVTPPATTATTFYTCDATNKPVTTQGKLSPDRTTSGVCPSNQCFYTGVDTVMATAKCVPSDTWVRDDYCANGLWTTRTHLLANDLAGAFPSGYILHCDKAPEAINRPTIMQGYSATPTIPRMGSVCVAQDFSNPPRVVVGATLNNDLGRNTGQGYAPATVEAITLTSNVGGAGLKPFVAHIVDPKLSIDTTALCTEANTWADVDTYLACPATQGSIIYNALTETVAFSTENGLQISTVPRNTPIDLRVNTPVKPLNGYRIYSYKNARGSVDGAWQREGTGTAARDVITVVYTSGSVPIDPRGLISARFGATSTRATVTPGTGSYTVTVTAPTQADWEYLTLQIRP